MPNEHCAICDLPYAHEHGTITSPAGIVVPAIIHTGGDPRAEVRDPDSGEVIFPAVKGPLRVIAGGLKEPSDG